MNKIQVLAKLYQLKYKIANNEFAFLKAYIERLFEVVNKQYNILRTIADCGAKNPKTKEEKYAIAGYKFVNELVSIIDYLKANIDNITLEEIKQAVQNMSNLIAEASDEVQNDRNFAHVAELIFQMFKIRNKSDIKLRNDQYTKMRQGLMRINDILKLMLEKMQDVHDREPEVIDVKDIKIDNFKPSRGLLSENDIKDFILQYGEEYGITSKQDWEIVVKDDKDMLSALTTVINALNRGHAPIISSFVKEQVKNKLNEHYSLLSNKKD